MKQYNDKRIMLGHFGKYLNPSALERIKSKRLIQLDKRIRRTLMGF